MEPLDFSDRDKPAKIQENLIAYMRLFAGLPGMPGHPGGNWLWCDLTNLAPAPSTPAGFHIERVCNDQMMAEWVRTSENGFGGQEGDLACYYDAYARHGYGPEVYSLHFTGYLGDIPVTSGTLLDSGGRAAIYDVSTLPTYRRQGMGGAPTHALLAEMRRRGYLETWAWSSDVGKSVYQKLGFVEGDFGLRAYSWRKVG